MKCPKCHYLSFDPEPRCRNCGYGFTLAETEVSLKPDAPLDTLADFTLRDTDADSQVARAAAAVALVDPPAASPPAAATATRASHARERREPPSRPVVPPVPVEITPVRRSTVAADEPAGEIGARAVGAPPTTEMPLFVKGMPFATEVSQTAASEAFAESDVPLVSVPTEPRAPLSVRKKTPEPAPARPRPASPARKLGPLDRDLLEDLQRLEKVERKEAAAEARAAARAALPADRAGAGKRLGAAAIDATLLGALSAGVLAATLRWCELPWSRISVLPIAPTVAFLLLVGLGYLLMFTAAGGQTVGKMALGIRVITQDTEAVDGATLSWGQAAKRACLTVPSVAVLGLGFLPALFGEERGIHDRLSHTRVVRA